MSNQRTVAFFATVGNELSDREMEDNMDAITWRCTAPGAAFASITWTRQPDGSVHCRLLFQGEKPSHGYARPGSEDLCALAFENACHNLGIHAKRPLAGKDDILSVLRQLAKLRGVGPLTVHRQVTGQA